MAVTSAANKPDIAPAERALVIKRTFDAPRDLVWKVWSDPAHSKQWWGPKGFTAPLVEIDGRPGGKWRAHMRSPDGMDFWQHGVFREVVPPERVSYTFIWDQEPDHEMLVTVTFAERGRKTEMTFRQTGFKSLPEREGHEGGWSEAFDRFAALLEELNGGSNAGR
jgi:uncharacterized protein YndB with AHSA1/START domain